jgi:hypothetical protein
MEIKMFGRRAGKTMNIKGKPVKPKMTHGEYLSVHNNFFGSMSSAATATEAAIMRIIKPLST